ncbi:MULTISPECIES: hypothetical protein [Cupriavidus]
MSQDHTSNALAAVVPNRIRVHDALGSRWQVFPVYPSAGVRLAPAYYLSALQLLTALQTDGVFADGEILLVPEYETAALRLLVARFAAELTYGCAKESEYAKLAIRAGVDAVLVRLGNAVFDITGQSAAAMVESALHQPDATQQAWSTLYRASMDTH